MSQPGEATFSRAFAEFADSEFPARVHAAMIRSPMRDTVVEHISRNSTAIEARERPETKPKRGRGRPRKGEAVERPERRLGRQRDMGLDEMIGDLPKARRGNQAEREGPPRVMDGLQAAHRRRRWRR